MAAMQPGSVDCVITDPPYGETSLDWDDRVDGWLDSVQRVLATHGSLWCFGSMRFFIERASDFAEWKIAQDVVWEKHNGTGLFNDRFRRVHELIVQFYPRDRAWSQIYKKPLFTNDATARTVRKKGRPAQWIGKTGETIYRSEDGGPRLMRSVMFSRSEHMRAVHPTQKPVACILPLVEYSCREGGLILDPFAGSGSVGAAASLSHRHAILMELREEYVTAAQRRMDSDAPLLAETVV